MELNNITIGDWIGYPLEIENNGKKVKTLFHIKIKTPEQLCHILQRIDNFEPIPITNDILKLNNFINGNSGSHLYINNIEIWYYGNGNLDIYQEKLDDSRELYENDIFFCRNIKYIHELQHALKLCKINKEIRL